MRCNVRVDVVTGFVVALVLIPKAIAFSIVAGENPKGVQEAFLPGFA